ncbi:amino acid ABC transporter ATP-binding protein [Isosphaeraceae bacterium EP7]
MIEVRGLIKRHGASDVLRGVDLRVERGEVAAIVGPSGGGKSTFLRCLNGLESIEGGRIEIDGQVLTSTMTAKVRETTLLSIRRRVGMVFQAFNLFSHQTALQNVAEGPRSVLGLPRLEAEELARTLLARVGLADKVESRPGQLSGGQQQRVAIARALAMQPVAILFDEPTSALDPRMAGEVLAVINDLARDGLTMIVVTHAMEFARRVAQTVHVFEGGRVARSGPPDEVLAPETAAIEAA